MKKKTESVRKELEWLRRRLHGHSFDEKTVNLEYVDARIDDIINVFLTNSRE